MDVLQITLGVSIPVLVGLVLVGGGTLAGLKHG